VYGVALRQAALGRCVADMNKKEEYRRWRKKNVDFMDKVRVYEMWARRRCHLPT
jgi:hypothetical protein